VPLTPATRNLIGVVTQGLSPTVFPETLVERRTHTTTIPMSVSTGLATRLAVFAGHSKFLVVDPTGLRSEWRTHHLDADRHQRCRGSSGTASFPAGTSVTLRVSSGGNKTKSCTFTANTNTTQRQRAVTRRRIDHSSGSAANSRLVFLYHFMPDTGRFHLPFIA